MRGADGKPLKIIQTIAAGDYMTFGMYLLQDENGVEVELIEKNNKDKGAERVTQSILQKWLTSGAAPTRTYQHLIECLEQSELGALADLIGMSNRCKTSSNLCTCRLLFFDNRILPCSSTFNVLVSPETKLMLAYKST